MDDKNHKIEDYKKRNYFISVIIPTKNRAEGIKKTLESLKKQTYPDFEVIIVDGNSTDNTKEVCLSYNSDFPVAFIDGTGQGLVHDMNIGWKYAKGDIIIRTDDDVFMSKGWLEAINDTFNLSGNIGGVTGPTIMPKEYREGRDIFSYQDSMKKGNPMMKIIGRIYFNYLLEGKAYRASHWFRSGAFGLGSNYEDCLNIKEPIKVNNLEACNFSVKKEILKEIGGFDERYKTTGDYHEGDAALKIKEKGYDLIFNSKAKLYHCPSTQGVFSKRQNSYYRMANFINFYFRHIKPNSLDKLLRFTTYVAFLNLYWTYKFVSTRNFGQLGGVIATPIVLAKNIVGIRY